MNRYEIEASLRAIHKEATGNVGKEALASVLHSIMGRVYELADSVLASTVVVASCSKCGADGGEAHRTSCSGLVLSFFGPNEEGIMGSLHLCSKCMADLLEDVTVTIRAEEQDKVAEEAKEVTEPVGGRLASLEERVALLESAERIITQGEVDKLLEHHTPRNEPDIPF